MANAKKNKSGKSLIPPDPVGLEKIAFKRAVKRTKTTGTAPMDDYLTDNDSSTTSVAKKPNTLATGPTSLPAENIIPVRAPEEPKKEGSFSTGSKIVVTMLGLSGAIIVLIYFFSKIDSKLTEDSTNISNLEKNQESLKKDLTESINKVESRLDDRINRLDSKLEQPLRVQNQSH